MDLTKVPRKLWEHPNPQDTAMGRLMQICNQQHGLRLKTFDDLYSWSVTHRAAFFGTLFHQCNFMYEGSYSQVVGGSMPINSLPRWFDGLRINYAENVLWTRRPSDPVGHRSTRHKEDDKIAITEIREGNTSIRHVTYGELRQRTAELAAALRARGVGVGDRVVAVGSHALMTTVILLATSWLGAIFSSSSTDMGVGGLLQRTVQINPKFVFFEDGAQYNGKVLDLREKIQGMVEGLKECPAFEKLVVVTRFQDKPFDTSSVPQTERLETFLEPSRKLAMPPIARIGFQDPHTVYYSSGTTGIPKAIVHGGGALLLSMKKEGRFHFDIDPDAVCMQYTTTGWIMYASTLGHLQAGARSVVFDGSPFLPDLKVLLRVLEEQRVTHAGINPRWLGELMKNGVKPRDEFNLSSLGHMTCTGMVLPDQVMEWFYDEGFPKRTQLSNMSGGTDIAGCFALGNPLAPLYVGGCMGGSLGTHMAIFDHEHDGAGGKKAEPLKRGQTGDLVSTAAFPNLPVFLWNDGQQGSKPGPKYRAAYFDRFEGVWAQGDFCVIHPKTGALIFLGRSDGVLNPSGIRFGSADIYSVIERFFPSVIAESLCVGQRRPKDLDESVVLFLLMKQPGKLDSSLVGQIRRTIARELTKRHVPKYIFEAPEFPVTVNGKKVELPVKHIISGKTVKPSGTLLNPQSLDFFYRFQNIERLVEPQAKL